MDVYSGSVHVVDDVCYEGDRGSEQVRNRTNCRMIKRSGCKRKAFTDTWKQI